MPYTYLIGWSRHNKFYYGARWAKNSSPNDLWKTYFTSSKHVKNFVEKYGDPDIIQIRNIFDSSQDAKLWEEQVLRRMNVISDNRFLNKNVNGKFLKEGPQSKDHVEKRISATTISRKRNGTYFVSEETKKKISDSTKGVSKPHSEEHKTAIQNRLQSFNRRIICCPHCGKQGQHTNMKRWHFDNCKLIPHRLEILTKQSKPI